MFACQIRVMLAYEYSTIWVNANLTCLLNRSEFLNPNITHLLNGSIVLICLLDFIYKKNKKKKKLILVLTKLIWIIGSQSVAQIQKIWNMSLMSPI